MPRRTLSTTPISVEALPVMDRQIHHPPKFLSATELNSANPANPACGARYRAEAVPRSGAATTDEIDPHGTIWWSAPLESLRVSCRYILTVPVGSASRIVGRQPTKNLRSFRSLQCLASRQRRGHEELAGARPEDPELGTAGVRGVQGNGHIAGYSAPSHDPELPSAREPDTPDPIKG